MMSKDATVRARIQPDLKKRVETTFEKLGLSTTEAITLFYRQVDLRKGLPLDTIHRDPKLIGSYQGRRECHIESDWLLIYKTEEGRIIFERTGSHSDLFK